jgi:hypothetical protein
VLVEADGAAEFDDRVGVPSVREMPLALLEMTLFGCF